MTVNTVLGKITGSKSTLNKISLALNYAAKDRNSVDMIGCANEYKEASDTIYDALDKLGYYNSVKR